MNNWSREDLVKEINWLRDVSDRRFKRMQERRNDIMRLEDELRDKKQNSNDSRKFYWAEEVK